MPFGGLRKTTTSEISSREDSRSRESSNVQQDTVSDRKSRNSTPPREKTPSKRELSSVRSKREVSPQKSRKDLMPQREKIPLHSRRETETFCKGHEEYEDKIRTLERKLSEKEADHNELYDQMGEWEELFKNPQEYRKAYESQFNQSLFDIYEDKFIKHLQNTGKWPSIRPSPSLVRSSAPPKSVKPYESRYARVPSSMIMRSGLTS